MWVIGHLYWVWVTICRRHPRPGRPATVLPSCQTVRPFTHTRTIPVETSCGSAGVAWSIAVAGVEEPEAAKLPAAIVPRRVSPTCAAERLVIFMIAVSSGITFCSRT
jgi:hypothetical protein